MGQQHGFLSEDDWDFGQIYEIYFTASDNRGVSPRTFQGGVMCLVCPVTIRSTLSVLLASSIQRPIAYLRIIMRLAPVLALAL